MARKIGRAKGADTGKRSTTATRGPATGHAKREPASRGTRRIAAAPKGAGSQLVYELLGGKILTLEFPPGMPIEEARLVELFGVSRTPVREALIRLAADGLVVQASNRSASVAPLDLTDLRQYFEAVNLAQRAVTRWAAQRRRTEDLSDMRRHMQAFENAMKRRDGVEMIQTNRDFHVSIATAADNDYMRSVCVRLYNQGLRVGRIAVSYDFDRDNSLSSHLERIVAEHRLFIDMIEAGDADGAEALAGAHAELGRQRTVGNIARLLSAEK